MSDKRQVPSNARETAALALVGMLAAGVAVQGQERKPALAFDREQGYRAELVGLRFADRVEGTNRVVTVNQERIKDYRMAVATVRIEKAEGVELTLACADVTLHYYHSGDTAEVAPCEGLSGFSTVRDTDRSLNLRPPNQGPGFLKQSTQAAATAAPVVFIDVLFSGMESSTSDAWIAIGRVDAAAPLRSEGWRDDSAPTCTETSPITLNKATSGSWESSCHSVQRSGRYARFFTFSLPSTTSVQIDLESGEDAFLYLLRGAAPTGEVMSSDDDGGDGENARLTRRLEAGTYTVEATTYEAGTAGRFTVRVQTTGD
jgi:hypothetical protein